MENNLSSMLEVFTDLIQALLKLLKNSSEPIVLQSLTYLTQSITFIYSLMCLPPLLLPNKDPKPLILKQFRLESIEETEEGSPFIEPSKAGKVYCETTMKLQIGEIPMENIIKGIDCKKLLESIVFYKGKTLLKRNFIKHFGYRFWECCLITVGIQGRWLGVGVWRPFLNCWHNMLIHLHSRFGRWCFVECWNRCFRIYISRFWRLKQIMIV